MLEGLRRNMKTVIWFLIIVFGATIFIAWGLHFAGRGWIKDYVAKINTKKITYEEFTSLYRQWADRYRKIYGEEFDDEMAENLRRIILNNMIFDELAYQEAKKNKIRVTGYEIEEGLKTLSIFQNEQGQFDPARYLQGKRVLPKNWWRAQAEEMKRTLMVRKLEMRIRDSIKVSEADLLNYYREKNASMRISYIPVERKSFSIQISDTEVNKFYDANKEKYKKPDQVKVEYVAAPKPGEEDIPDSATRNGIINNLRATMEKAIKDLRAGKSMKEVGENYNLEYNVTPLFSKTYNIDNSDFQIFSQHAFTLSDPGELTEIIDSPKYYYILRLVQRIDAHIPTLEEIKNDLVKEILRKKQDEMAKKRAGEILERLRQGGEKDYASSIRTTAFFNVWKEIPGIKGNNELKKSILDLKIGEWSMPLKMEDGYCIVKVMERKVPASIDSKDTETLQELRQELEQVLAYKVMQEWFRNLRAKARIENVLFPEEKEETQKEEM